MLYTVKVDNEQGELAWRIQKRLAVYIVKIACFTMRRERRLAYKKAS